VWKSVTLPVDNSRAMRHGLQSPPRNGYKYEGNKRRSDPSPAQKSKVKENRIVSEATKSRKMPLSEEPIGGQETTGGRFRKQCSKGMEKADSHSVRLARKGGT